MRSRGSWLIVVGAILVMPVGVYGQEATLSGTITDSTGGVCPASRCVRCTKPLETLLKL